MMHYKTKITNIVTISLIGLILLFSWSQSVSICHGRPQTKVSQVDTPKRLVSHPLRSYGILSWGLSGALVGTGFIARYLAFTHYEKADGAKQRYNEYLALPEGTRQKTFDRRLDEANFYRYDASHYEHSSIVVFGFSFVTLVSGFFFFFYSDKDIAGTGKAKSSKKSRHNSVQVAVTPTFQGIQGRISCQF